MAINNLQDKFVHELKDIYDAEHQFLKGQEEMLQKATDQNLQNMITQHIDQSRQQIRNLDQVFNLLGRDNLGGIQQTWTESALSDSFGRLLSVLPRQQAELAVRFTW